MSAKIESLTKECSSLKQKIDDMSKGGEKTKQDLHQKNSSLLSQVSQLENKMKEMDMKENSSKSLLANVLDMDDDFRPSPLNHHVFPQTPHLPKSSQSNTASLFR